MQGHLNVKKEHVGTNLDKSYEQTGFDYTDGTMQLTHSISQVSIKKGLQTCMVAFIFKLGEP